MPFTALPEEAMLPSATAVPQPPRGFSIGIDTSLYDHYAAFLGDDLQPAPTSSPSPSAISGSAAVSMGRTS
jgi:hypothetical protein